MTNKQMTALIKLQKAYAEALALMTETTDEYADQLIQWQETTAQDQMDEKVEELEYEE